jgi:hypothetical protein
LTIVLSINSMHCGENAFGDSIVEKGLWPHLSPDLNPCDFYFREYSRMSVFLTHEQKTSQIAVSSVSTSDLKRTLNNMSLRCLPPEETI